MSAAADELAAAAGRVSVVASIGYCAFLGDHLTVVRALLVVAALLALATLVTNALRPVPTSHPNRPRLASTGPVSVSSALPWKVPCP